LQEGVLQIVAGRAEPNRKITLILPPEEHYLRKKGLRNLRWILPCKFTRDKLLGKDDFRLLKSHQIPYLVVGYPFPPTRK
jgi:hypothetical protein